MSCGLPTNVMEHAGQLATDLVGVLEARDVGEKEAWDGAVSEVGRGLTSGAVVQDMTLVEKDSGVPGSLLIEDRVAGESRIGSFAT